MPKYVVMREPVLMEDEGKPRVYDTFEVRSDAEAWIAQQSGGYWFPQNFYIIEIADGEDAPKDPFGPF